MATGIGQYGFGAKQTRYADAGKYYTFANPTPGTGIISGAVTSLADTTPLLIIKNNNPVASGIKVYLDYLRLYCTVVGVGHTLPKMVFRLDTSQAVARYTSGGSELTPQNTNADVANSNAVQVYFGALLAAAAGNTRLIASYAMKSMIEFAYDSWVWDFGAPSHGVEAGLADSATVPSHAVFGAPPIVIGPQQHFLAHLFAGSMSTGITLGVDGGFSVA